MKKALVLATTLLVVLITGLAACSGGTPKAPVSKVGNLDKLVTVGMTVDQVNALMTSTFKQTGTLYSATRMEKTTTGSWIITNSKTATGSFQVLLFPPSTSSPNNYYTVLFTAGKVTDKVWFDLQGGAVIESNLKGK